MICQQFTSCVNWVSKKKHVQIWPRKIVKFSPLFFYTLKKNSIYFFLRLFSWCRVFRFIALPYTRSLPRPRGPASQVFYTVPDYLLVVDQDMDYPAQFRRELSRAFSLAYFLRPHAIIFSQIEERPLADYHDSEAYRRASLLYTSSSGPVLDQQRSVYAVNRGWRLNLRDAGHVLW